jgi:hypothetical protein
MKHNTHDCPWCGHELTAVTDRCSHCDWSREKSNGRRAMKMYIGFLVFMFILSIGVFIYAFKQVSSPLNSLTGTPGSEKDSP